MDWRNVEMWLALAGVLGLLGGLAVTKWVKNKDTRSTIAKYVDMAYWAVEDIKLKTDTQIDDAVAEALDFLRRRLKAEGVPLTDDVAELAKDTWSAMHGKKKTDLRISGAYVVNKLIVTDQPRTDGEQPGSHNVGSFGAKDSGIYAGRVAGNKT